MGFRLVTKSVTLNDLERRNGHIVYVISPNSVAFCGYLVKVVEDRQIIPRVKCGQKNLVFNGVSIGDIRRGSPPATALKLTPSCHSLAKI